jgi:acetylornithine deacetylase/succinyl-diaminopimelate desuccinylase-like protein
VKELLRHLERKRGEHLEELGEFLSIPSVSTRPEHAEDVKRAASWVAQRLTAAGLLDVTVHQTAGHPIVTARTLQQKGAPTVLVYGHYDVQPPDPLELWESPPFEPQVRKNKLFARGASDDKGQVFIYLKVLEAFAEVQGGVPINVKLVLEGEEEVGSPNLVPFVKEHAKELACDLVLVSDTHMEGIRVPSITTGLRGLAAIEVTVQGAKKDLHSGTYGGSVANPIQVLAELLVACKDAKSGKVKIPGFYDAVRPLSAKEKRSMASVPFSERDFLKQTGAPALFGERGRSTLERVGSRPTFEVNGIWGGYIGEGVKTVLPSTAHAKISMRLVPDQDPVAIGKAVEAYLRQMAPDHVRVTVRHDRNRGYPTAVDPDFPAMKVAAAALKRVFGKEPVYTREGGSIPIVADFRRILGAEVILLGFGLPDDNLHAPNEKFDLRMLDKGIKAVAHLFHDLGQSAQRDGSGKRARPRPSRGGA